MEPLRPWPHVTAAGSAIGRLPRTDLRSANRARPSSFATSSTTASLQTISTRCSPKSGPTPSYARCNPPPLRNWYGPCSLCGFLFLLKSRPESRLRKPPLWPPPPRLRHVHLCRLQSPRHSVHRPAQAVGRAASGHVCARRDAAHQPARIALRHRDRNSRARCDSFSDGRSRVHRGRISLRTAIRCLRLLRTPALCRTQR